MQIEYLQELLSTWFYNKTFRNIETAEKGLVVQAARDLHRAAQHRVQWMAFAAGGAGVTVGLFIGWLLWSA